MVHSLSSLAFIFFIPLYALEAWERSFHLEKNLYCSWRGNKHHFQGVLSLDSILGDGVINHWKIKRSEFCTIGHCQTSRHGKGLWERNLGRVSTLALWSGKKLWSTKYLTHCICPPSMDPLVPTKECIFHQNFKSLNWDQWIGDQFICVKSSITVPLPVLMVISWMSCFLTDL